MAEKARSGRPTGPVNSSPKAKRAARTRSMTNLLKMGHCAPTVMQTLLDMNNLGLAQTEQEWLVKLMAGMPGGIGDTGFECGGLTSPLVLLGLRHGLSEMHQGLPLVFYKGHDLRQRFVRCNATLLCSQIRGHDRLPIRCIKVIRRSPELYAETVSSTSNDAIGGEKGEAYRRLYSYLLGKGFHCAHAVFQSLRQTIPVGQELLDGTSGFVGGTFLSGMTCSAFTAGVMAIGLRIGEIENSPRRVMRMIATMVIGGNAFADDINKFNRIMNIGKKMSEWFIQEFGSTQCHAVTQCDFSCVAGVCKYIESDGVARCRTIAERVAEKVRNIIEEAEAGGALPGRSAGSS